MGNVVWTWLKTLLLGQAILNVVTSRKHKTFDGAFQRGFWLLMQSGTFHRLSQHHAMKLYVPLLGNTPYNVTQADLEELFAEVGTVESANVITDKFSGQSRGFGFVEMASGEEAQAAIKQYDGYELKGRTLKVNEARPREDRSGGRSDSGGRRERRW